MPSAAPARFTEEEYLALERASDRKHEYWDGQIVAMAGARPPHNMLCANVLVALSRLCGDGPCVALTSDQRVYVPRTHLYAYPDASIACGPREYDGGDPPSLLNPTIIVEVTSDSSEDFDRGTKFLHYQSIASLRDYLILSHREHRIDHYRRLTGGQWHLATYAAGGENVELVTLGGSFLVADVYRSIDLREGAVV